MKKRGKIILAVTISLVVLLGTGGFLTYFFLFNPALFIRCESRPFTHYPIDMDRLEYIVPLGNLNPPGHTYPTDHMYFFTNDTAYPDGFEIYAPGALIITNIEKVIYNPPQVAGVTTDYTIDFSVCSKVSGIFGHVNNLSSTLSSKVGDFGSPDQSYEIDGRTYTVYKKRTYIKVAAGQLLGKAGIGGGYDFWLKDTRVTNNWINNEFVRHSKNIVCPLDYFREDLRLNLTARLGGWQGINPPGYCGRITYDVPDTAQGIWAQNGKSGERVEEYGLALVYSNFNVSLGAISVGNAGNSTWDRRVYYFEPLDGGFLNRQFNQVSADGEIYYYLAEGFKVGGDIYKAILLKMTGSRSLQLQFVSSGSPLPADPRVLFNETAAVGYYR
jgi:hypothetical protein